MSDDWRIMQLPDGRVAEFIEARWAGDEAPVREGYIASRVTAMVGDLVISDIVYLSDARILAAMEREIDDGR